jgi:hypothetical protein
MTYSRTSIYEEQISLSEEVISLYINNSFPSMDRSPYLSNSEYSRTMSKRYLDNQIVNWLIHTMTTFLDFLG